VGRFVNREDAKDAKRELPWLGFAFVASSWFGLRGRA